MSLYTEEILARAKTPKKFNDVIPRDSVFQCQAGWYVKQLSKDREGRVLDLGCGEGNSIDLFKRATPKMSWTGLDIETSGAVSKRTREDGEFLTYDGVNIPLEDSSFDIVFSLQVFEHVRHPEPLLAEISRVLKPGGVFFGAVSYLEPLHGKSVFNFTPHGWFLVNQDAGLMPVQFRAGKDGITLIEERLRLRLYSEPKKHSSAMISPYNKAIMESEELGVLQKNAIMLQYAAHIIFVCKKA